MNGQATSTVNQDPASAASVEEQVRVEAMRAMLEANRGSVLVAIAAIMVAGFFTSRAVPGPSAWIWALGLCSYYLLRLLADRAYRKRAGLWSTRDLRRWAWGTAISMLFSGLLWSLLFLRVVTPENLVLKFSALVLLIVVAAVPMRSYGSFLPAYMAFSFGILVPVGVTEMSKSTLGADYIGLIVMGYLLAVNLVAIRAGRDFDTMMRLQLERLLLLKNLEEAKDAADAGSRAKSQFIANVSHEIRTPLHGLLGIAGLLHKAAENDEQKRHAQTILDSGKSLMAVINDVLDFSKIEAGKLDIERAPFDVEETVQRALALYENGARDKNLKLTCSVAADVPGWVVGDAVRLGAMIGNLVGNAIKFTDAGTVRLTVAPAPGARGLIRFSVRDTGIGISAEDQRRLFEPFAQLENSNTRRIGGTGLGLAIVKDLAELQGGTVGLESAPGVGSTFWFELPLEPVARPIEGGAAFQAVPGPGPGAVPRPRPADVLLVEDNAVNREVATAIMHAAGMRVHEAVNGRHAVESFRERVPELILMDCQMPEMDGFEATLQVRALERQMGLKPVPIVALTAHGGREHRDMCLDIGMNDCLVKPFREDELLRVLATHLGSVGGASEAPPECAAAPQAQPRAGKGAAAHAGDQSALPLFNPGPLDALKNLQPAGMPDLRVRIVGLFHTTSEAYWESLRNAVVRGDCEAAWKTAHALKSSCANVGGDRLARRLGLMEGAGRANDLQTLCAQLPVALGDYAQLLPALDEYMAALANASVDTA